MKQWMTTTMVFVMSGLAMACGGGSGETDVVADAVTKDAAIEETSVDLVTFDVLQETETVDTISGDALSETREELCRACVLQRCDSESIACVNDPECLLVEKCLTACTSIACMQACSNDQTLSANASKLGTCHSEKCWLFCVAAETYLPEPGVCQPLHGTCDLLINSCCDDIDMCPPFGGSCCRKKGEACTGENQCCFGVHAMGCGITSKKCEEPTCFSYSCDTQNGPCVSQCDQTMPCCDSRLTCPPFDSLIGSRCCASTGTVVNQSESELCCSGLGMTLNPDGTYTCSSLPD